MDTGFPLAAIAGAIIGSAALKCVHRRAEPCTPEAAESMWSELTDRDPTTAEETVEGAPRTGGRVLHQAGAGPAVHSV